MSHAISEYTRAIAPHGGFTAGDVKDDPSGTLVNRLMLNDLIQLQAGIMAIAGLTPNAGDDTPTLSGSQLIQALKKCVDSNFGNLDATQSGAWTNFGSLVYTASGGGSVTSGTTVYNKYKVHGNTLQWTIQFRTATVAGTVSFINIPWPLGLTGGDWKNVGGQSVHPVFFGSVTDTDRLNVILHTGGSGVPYLQCYYDGTNFPTSGNLNFDINITTEI